MPAIRTSTVVRDVPAARHRLRDDNPDVAGLGA
jgi:hypothetical protein